MAIYAVGDVQGCFDPLCCVLEQCAFDARRDVLWVVGDCVNRGPHSLETLRFLRGLGERAVLVLGNHDLHLLAVAHGAQPASREDSLQAVCAAPDREELLQWLRHRPLLHRDEAAGYAMVHAGIPPQWSLEEAAERAREVERALRGPDWLEFLHHMYGDEPVSWREDLEGYPRLRMIVNYFTRMRLCTREGTLYVAGDASGGGAPAEFQPWFAHRERKSQGEKLIFGHWSALDGVAEDARLFPLDTGCVWGGVLTAMRLEDGERFLCDCAGGFAAPAAGGRQEVRPGKDAGKTAATAGG